MNRAGTSGQAGSSGRAEERAHHSGKMGANMEKEQSGPTGYLRSAQGKGSHSS